MDVNERGAEDEREDMFPHDEREDMFQIWTRNMEIMERDDMDLEDHDVSDEVIWERNMRPRPEPAGLPDILHLEL